MKKRTLSFVLAMCIFATMFQITSTTAYAVSESTNVRNRLDEIVTELNEKLQTSGVFSVNGKNCWSKRHTCNNCSLYGILSEIGEDVKAWEKLSSNGWSCSSFAKYVLVKTFGTAKDTKDTVNIGLGNKESTYSTFRTGDLFYSSSHWMIFLSNDSTGVNVLDANGNGDLKIRYTKYAYSSKNLSGNITVWQSPNWDKVNNTTVQPQPIPVAPIGLKAERKSNTTAKISWNAISDATYYVEYRSPNTKNIWVAEADYGSAGYGNSTSYTATRLGNHKYEFRVCSVNSAGIKSSWSSVLIYTHSKNTSTIVPTAETGTVTISYNTNGSSIIKPADHSVKKDSNGVATFNLSSATPKRSDYIFLGWRLENDAAYSIDEAGASISIQLGTSTTNETLTYYAQWASDPSSGSNDFTIDGYPVKKAEKNMTVNAGSYSTIRLCSAPTSNNTRLGGIPNNTSVYVYCSTIQQYPNDDGTYIYWAKVRWNGIDGWVNWAYLR